MPRTITIRIRADKHGKLRAHYFGLAMRWLPLPLDKAERALATGEIFGGKAVAHIDAPTHTDMMVSPESLDEFMEANPLPE